MDDLAAQIENTLVDDPPAAVSDGGVIRAGCSPELDELRSASADGRNWIAALQAKEQQRTGVKSLKVNYNRVFGFYIEITKSNLEHVPEDYIRKQTLANCERFVTPELKEFFQKFSVNQRLFNDGNGFAEVYATPQVDALEEDQWLFACCYYQD
jgi:DNA mismatch repair protein MutS